MTKSEQTSNYYQSRDNRLITGLSLKVRRRVFKHFMKRFSEATKIIDVGVTSERYSEEANFLEKLHPDPSRIHAVGIEDAAFLEKDFPGLKFTKIKPNSRLPFADNYFDVAYSHAVIEHIVEDENRLQFVGELLRVARAVFLTTPNLYFPVETHTKIPLLHFISPPLFNYCLDRGLFGSAYRTSNLKLMSGRQLQGLARSFPNVKVEMEKVSLGGLTSNHLVIMLKQ